MATRGLEGILIENDSFESETKGSREERGGAKKEEGGRSECCLALAALPPSGSKGFKTHSNLRRNVKDQGRREDEEEERGEDRLSDHHPSPWERPIVFLCFMFLCLKCLTSRAHGFRSVSVALVVIIFLKKKRCLEKPFENV